jgi:hypothetical protein
MQARMSPFKPRVSTSAPKDKAMRIRPFLLCTILAFTARHAEASDDLESLGKSPVWQVRYCIPAKYDTPSTEARRVLERLSTDEVPAVAQQAFVSYSRTFVVLDREIVKKAFARGDFDIIGADVLDREFFETPEFWLHDLDQPSAPDIRARAVRALGMCGTNAHTANLSGHLTTTNPYLLIELALAFHRLGDEAQYLKAIETILALPIKDTLSHQTDAIDCLIQTHPEGAKAAWKAVHEKFELTGEGQPEWVYAHIAQEARLP